MATPAPGTVRRPWPAPSASAVQSYSASSGKEWKDKARRAEDLGYSTLVRRRPLHRPGPVAGRHAATPCRSGRRPGHDARRRGHRPRSGSGRGSCASTTATRSCWPRRWPRIDLFSEGRLELGLGAGWLENEYRSMGVPLRSAGPADRPPGRCHRGREAHDGRRRGRLRGCERRAGHGVRGRAEAGAAAATRRS